MGHFCALWRCGFGSGGWADELLVLLGLAFRISGFELLMVDGFAT